MDTTNVQFLESVCRTCMHELTEIVLNTVDFKPVQTWKSMFETIMESDMLTAADLLSKTMPQIKVQVNDNLPKKICSECLERLLNSYRFQQMCLQNEQKLHELLANKKENIHIIIGETSKTSAREWPQEEEESILVAKVQENGVMSMNHFPSVVPVDPLQNFVKVEIDEGVDDGVQYSSDDSMPINRLKEEILAAVAPDKEVVRLTPRTYECHKCHKIFSQIRSWKIHANREKCNPIDPGANKKLAHHVDKARRSNIPKGKKPRRRDLYKEKLPKHKCKICDKSFFQSHTLKEHMRVHTGERPHLCEECGKSFRTQELLQQHTLRHFEKTVDCPQCPAKFYSKSDLCKHKSVHEEEKQHVCDVCSKAFHKPYELRRHKRYHSDEKPYKCDYCDMRFTVRYGQQRHMRIHTGEKPYKCEYCEFAFVQGNDKMKHLRIHLGENVYRCKLCPDGFRKLSQLRAHFATHKNDDAETQERNLKALKQAEAKLPPKLVEKNQKATS